jgi:cobalt-zinc-cadmium efflux system outer membrane protein
MMRRALVARLGMVALVCGPAVASAKNYKLTLDQALALARDRAPEVVIEGARVREVKAHRVGASVLLRENPEIEGAAGWRRSGGGGSSTDLELGISQMFEVGGKRGARIARADAEQAAARSRVADAARQAQLDVAVAFLRALAARERLGLAQASADSLESTRRAMERRAQKGDVAALEVNLAASASVRAKATVLARRAEADERLADLAAYLGIRPVDTVELVGTLEAGTVPAQDKLLRSAADRPDVAALAAEERAGQAEERLGRALRWPDIGLRAAYEREGDENVLLGGLVIRLPLFERGQEARATGRARRDRARIERIARTAAIERQIRSGVRRHAHLAEALALLKTEAIPVLEDSEKLLARSIETGLIGLTEYLAARRELLAAREEYLDRQVDVAIAAVELELTGGERP